MDLITYGLLNKAKANLDSPAFTGTPTAPTPLTPDNSNKLATTEFVRSVIATLKGFYLGVTTTTLVDEVTTNPDVVINGETVTAEDGNWVIVDGGEEFVYSGTVWQKFGDSNWISVIGDTYNPALTYNTGDCVIYMDGLYKCQEDNVTGDWDSAKWQATTVIDLITGGIPLENLSNVNIVNPQAGNHLVFDGTEWKNSTIVSPALSELSDVELEDVTDGQTLVYNDTTDKWENQDIPAGQVTKTATGNPIEISDGADAPLVKCTTEITGSQDLHGYDKPWVGGAGKNKLPLVLADIKSGNTSGTWSENAYTISGVTLTILTDDDGNITGIKANGTATSNITFRLTLASASYMTDGMTYKISGSIGGSYSTWCIWVESHGVHKNEMSLDGDGTFTYTSGQPQRANLSIDSGVTVTNQMFYPMLRLSTETDPTFAPYSNICPITAYTEGEIEVRGKNLVKQIIRGYVDSSNNIIKVDNNSETVLIKVVEGVTYTLSASTHDRRVIGYAGVDTLVNGTPISNIHTLTSDTWTAEWSGWTAWYVNSSTSVAVEQSVQVEEGETATSYEAPNSTTHTTTYPTAIYRGSEDCVNDSLDYDMPVIDLGNLIWVKDTSRQIPTYNAALINPKTNLSGWYSNVVCEQYFGSDAAFLDGSCSIFYTNRIYICDSRYPDAASFTTAVTGVKLAYELATPTTTPVIPTNLPIKSLLGYNHIESSTGDMEVEYITEEYQPLVDLIQDGNELPEVTSTDNNKVLTVVNGAWAKANPQTGMNESVVADEYDSTKTYDIADYCMHSGKLYKCNTANTTGAWDSAKWDETCVGDELILKTAVIVAPRVDQTATYTYNGTEQTLAFEYINSNNTIVTGNKHTDAGTYTCTVSLKNPNDLWSDTMDNVDKTFTWTINKITSSITLSPTTFYFDNGTPQTLTATVIGQPLVLSGYDTNLITITQVSAVNGVYTYDIKASGTAGTTTITASIVESTNYTAASATASVETEAFTPGATLVPWSSGTDQEITDMINSYYNGEITLEDVKSVWSIGDVRNVDISAMTATGVDESHRAQTVQMEILDFDHDTLTTPIGSITKALITVDMKNCLRDANVTDTTGSSNTEHGYINSSNTNVGGWTSCARRTWCNNVFYNALPSYFKSLVKPVDKLTSAGNTSSTINTDSDYCFLLSEIEIFGNTTYSVSGEGSQYAWLANATANRYKLPKWNSNSVSDRWWERSPHGGYSSNFCSVGGNGNANFNTASNANGLAPACCL